MTPEEAEELVLTYIRKNDKVSPKTLEREAGNSLLQLREALQRLLVRGTVIVDEALYLQSNLTFEHVSKVSERRHIEHFNGKTDVWTSCEWGCALAGETGELCNLLKKERRGDNIERKDIENEMADVYLYLGLLATHYGIDLPTVIRRKFNEKSDEVGCDIKL